jgi:hypothetical protein
MLKQPLLRFPSISLPQMLPEIKLLPLPESFSSRRFRQLLQQASAALENAVCSSRHGLILVPGRRLAVVLQGLRYHLGMAPALLLVELNVPTPPGVKWTGHSLRRCGATAAHALLGGLGRMEVSRVSALIHRRCGATFLRSSLLLRSPSATLPAYGSTTRSASSAHC